MYFPDSIPTTAVKHLMGWIKRCTPLMDELQAMGYHTSNKTFTPRQVKAIVEQLGEPQGEGRTASPPGPSPKGRGVITISRAASLSLASPPSLSFPLFPSLFTQILHSSLTYEIKEKEEKSGANLPYRPSDHARLYNFAEEIQRATSYRQSSWWITISDNRHELTRLLERRHENARNAINGQSHKT